jgi:hypothetical protein
MLCLEALDAAYPGPGRLKINAQDIAKVKTPLQKGSSFALFTKSRTFSIYSVQSAAISGKDCLIEYRVKKKLEIHEKLQKTLFINQSSIELDEEDLIRISQFSRELDKAAPALHIKMKTGSYLRFLFVDIENSRIIESYLQWDEWEKWESEILSLKKDMDFCIRHQQVKELQEKRHACKDLILKLMDQLKIPLKFKNNPAESYRIIHIYWDAPGVFIPFESLYEKLIIRNHCLIKKVKPIDQQEGFVSVYSEDLNGSLEETAAISGLLADRWKTEYFSGSNYEDYKTSFRNACLFHFSGHGVIENERGKIMIHGKGYDEIRYSNNLKLAFLNCCFSGMYPEGIVGSLLNLPEGMVIASPYQLPDKMDGREGFMRLFYSLAHPEDLSMVYCLSVMKYPEMGFFYRQFSGYCDNI